MDLAEIRKKAKKNGSRPAPKAIGAKSAADAKGEAALQEAPAAKKTPPPVKLAPSEELPAPQVELLVEDPLEALFAFSKGVELASEEIYLQGLAGEVAEEDLDLRQLLTFSLGKEEYALDISFIHEIIKVREITDIPRAPDFILGIISLRGIIIPVFDLKCRLKLGKAEFTPLSRIVVCQAGERSAGLLVDSIREVVRLPAQKIEPPPGVLSGLDRDLVEGVGRVKSKMMILLDLPNVLDAELI